jgi:hypothetical protein
MINSLSKKYTQHFYDWQTPFQGLAVNDSPVAIAPTFVPYVYPNFGKPVQHDDGRLPTLGENIVDVAKKIFAFFSKEETVVPELQKPVIVNVPELISYTVFLPLESKNRMHEFEQLLMLLSQATAHIAFEIVAQKGVIHLQITCAKTDSAIIQALFKVHFPLAVLQQNNDLLQCLKEEQQGIRIIELGLTEEFIRPLKFASEHETEPFVGLFGMLELLQEHELAVIQILLRHSSAPWKESIMRSVVTPTEQSFFGNAEEMIPCAKKKAGSPLFGCVLRIIVKSTTVNRSKYLSSHIGNVVAQLSSSPVNSLFILSNDEYNPDTQIVDACHRQSCRSPMLLNSQELMSFVHFPSDAVRGSNYISSLKRTKSLPHICEGHPFILGINKHNGIEKKVTLINERHCIITGSSGAGKSTLLLSMIIQNCLLGEAVILLDPHGDLADDVLKNAPPNRIKDIVIIDPSDSEYPISMNFLQAKTEVEKEVLASDLVSSFRKHSYSWGDSLDSIFNNAVSTMLHSNAGGTLHDLRRFLIDKEYRAGFLKTVEDPSLVFYWQKEFPMLKATSVAAILTRIDTFLRPRPVRNMICQQTCFDFEAVIEKKKIVVVKLAIGLIGSENAYLLGSLITAKVFQAALAGQNKDHRQKINVYIDECHQFLNPSTVQILEAGRKWGLNLVMAHQSRSQLTPEMADAINVNAATTICFRTGETDAKKIAEGFSFFKALDFQNLSTGEAIAKVDRPDFDFSFWTMPVKGEGNSEEVIKSIVEQSRKRYAVPRAQVEALIYESMGISTQSNEPVSKYQKQSGAEKKAEVTVTTELNESLIVEEITQEQTERKFDSKHRYMQTFIKQTAESFGYTAVIELQVPDGSGQIDVVLSKENKTIAVEISNTTDSTWETHNISKCIHANYDNIISIASDEKQLEKIKRKCMAEIAGFENYAVHFFTPDTFFNFLKQQHSTPSSEANMKGYRVNVSYDKGSKEEMMRKRNSVAQVMVSSLKRQKKK